MRPVCRPYRDETDFWRIRAFLRELLLLNNRRDLTWPVARFDYWRWHGLVNILDGRAPIESVIWLWETAGGELAAVLNPEDEGDAFLQVHPAYRSEALLEEMVETAEASLAPPTGSGPRLRVWAHESDRVLGHVLARRGYALQEWGEALRRRSLGHEVAVSPVAPGYTVRALGGEEELPARSWASWRAFHPDEPDAAYQGWEWYRVIQACPLYRRDLDIVAVAPGGEHAAFCTIWFDDVTRTGYVEPVGAQPDHQRCGLGRAVVTEGLRRLRGMGADLAYVGAYSDAANALYAACGFTTVERLEPWELA